jgi:hypothetical protein
MLEHKSLHTKIICGEILRFYSSTFIFERGSIKVSYITYCTWPEIVVVRKWKIGGHPLVVFIFLVFEGKMTLVTLYKF